MPKKKFIDKKNAVTFHLVHRSQRDPLQADEEAPQRVLLEAAGKDSASKRREEQAQYGIFADDDYDYMQHLRSLDEINKVEAVESFRVAPPQATKANYKVNLPAEVFASQIETNVGLLNKAAPVRGPQPDWDPDIVAALDDDFDFDDPAGELDDDFMKQANAIMEDEEYEEGEERSDFGSDFGSEDGDHEGFQDFNFDEEETKSRFTQYSMSSSVIRRNDNLAKIDDQFETLYEQYDDTEIGALDHEDITGHFGHKNPLLQAVLEEHEKTQEMAEAESQLCEAKTELDDDAEMEEESSSDSDRELLEMEDDRPKEKWDCESFLSTYSNLYNHPKKIEEPKTGKVKLTSRVGIPKEVLPDKGPTRRQVEREEFEETRVSLANIYRPKDETADEKKARKQSVKEERRLRRQEKKANKLAFKKEEIRQQKQQLNLTQNLQGIKIQ